MPPRIKVKKINKHKVGFLIDTRGRDHLKTTYLLDKVARAGRRGLLVGVGEFDAQLHMFEG